MILLFWSCSYVGVLHGHGHPFLLVFFCCVGHDLLLVFLCPCSHSSTSVFHCFGWTFFIGILVVFFFFFKNSIGAICGLGHFLFIGILCYFGHIFVLVFLVVFSILCHL